MNTVTTIRVCFVCTGNICRSPTAEGVFKQLAKDAGLAHAFHVESAGIGGWHVGERPDSRTLHAAKAQGFHLDSRAQQFKARDFDRFDVVVGMDRSHVDALTALATNDAMRNKISLARDHVPNGPRDLDVPDPYYDRGSEAFDEVVVLCREACAGLLAELRANHGLGYSATQLR